MDNINQLFDLIISFKKDGKITDDEYSTLLRMLKKLSHAIKTKNVKDIRQLVNMIVKLLVEIVA